MILGAWNKGKDLLETNDFNKEKLGETFILQIFGLYKDLNKKMLTENTYSK